MASLKLITQRNGSRYLVPVEMEVEGGYLSLRFRFDVYLKDEIKAMDGAKWNNDDKVWMVKDCPRNWFQLRYLMGQNPYAWYDREPLEFETRFDLFEQQRKMASEGITYRQCIWAAEMGLGKTLSAFTVMEWSKQQYGDVEWWWVGPLSALAAYHLEVRKWGLKIHPTRVMTYEALTKTMKNWTGGKAPFGVIFDEFSRCKTPGSQRSAAAYNLACGMRADHGEDDPFIIGMTGTPAPKSPLDWYWLAEIIKPGFLREGNIHKFKSRLAITVTKENTTTGGVYPELLGWRDSTDRCKHCGIPSEGHDIEAMSRGYEAHDFEPGVNEIAKLYSRMKGLVHVYFKRDWLKHLPEKQYRVIHCKPNRATLNAAEAIRAASKTTIQALTFLRELSDGFQYTQVESGTTPCTICNGSGRTKIPFVPEAPTGEIEPRFEPTDVVQMIEVECSNCNGDGVVPNYVRDVEVVTSPKDKILAEVLDEHDEDGRIVIYGGFTGTIDRVCKLVELEGWRYIRVDGRGWHTTVLTDKTSPSELIEVFQDKTGTLAGSDAKIAFIGHPRSAGMGITLTASSETLYYSNGFNGEDRMQSEDRIHRPGMDTNKGALITDIVHLPSDQLILDNLREKKRLQDLTLGQFDAGMRLASDRVASALGEIDGTL